MAKYKVTIVDDAQGRPRFKRAPGSVDDPHFIDVPQITDGMDDDGGDSEERMRIIFRIQGAQNLIFNSATYAPPIEISLLTGESIGRKATGTGKVPDETTWELATLNNPSNKKVGIDIFNHHKMGYSLLWKYTLRIKNTSTNVEYALDPMITNRQR